MATRAAIQGLFSIAAARFLGSENFGAFVASAALASSLTPWLGFGLVMVMLQRISAGSNTPRQELALCLRWYIFTLPLLAGIGYVLVRLILPSVGYPAFIIVIAELCSALVEPAFRFFQGQQNFIRMGQILLGLSFCRLAAVVLGWTAAATTLHEFCWCYLFFNSAYVAFIIFQLLVPTKKNSEANAVAPFSLTDGIPFATMASADKLNAEFDKTALVWAGFSSSAGNYSAAYRLADMATLPLTAAIETSIPGLFSAASKGRKEVINELQRVLFTLIPFAGGSGLVLYIAAPIAARLFGSEYSNIPAILRFLCLMPLTFGVWLAIRTTAISCGLKRWCTLVECCTVSISITLLLINTPIFGWIAAADITYASYICMTFLFVLGIVQQPKSETNLESLRKP